MAPDRFLQIREIRRQRDASVIQRLYFPEHPTDEERAFSATSAYVAQFYPQGSTPPNEHSLPPQHMWPSSTLKDRHRLNGLRPPRLPALHPPSPPKPKVPPERPCTQSYGPSGRNGIGFVASLLTPAQRSRTIESFRHS
ncbi:hypothetical protein CDL15_Pgr027200 [Punica granatum]|uniref:Uncharacterized protein n=1 Tax=Punica granatum TaxID=22663 RepID=A0A218W4I2_PUNGR|nr:hypothetical protein CDL15_Pgr027200 [Punica granatum]